MKVSVIIPAYNAAGTIVQTLESLCAQTFSTWEALVIDDGSTDHTAAVVADFVESDKRIRYIAQPHLGGGAARNKGIKLARFDWLLFLDADDWLAHEHLEKMTAALQSDSALNAVYCAWVRVTPEGEILPGDQFELTGDLFSVFTRWRPFPPMACVVHRSVVKVAGEWDTSLSTCQDWDFWQRVARTGARFGYVDAVLAYYRLRPGSLSKNDPRQLLADGLWVLAQGYASDPRVQETAAEHQNGQPESQLPYWKLAYVCWVATLPLGRGEDARWTLEAVSGINWPDFDPVIVAENLARCIPFGLCQTFDVWVNLWPEIAVHIDAFLQAFEAQTQALGLAYQARELLEQTIVRDIPEERPLTIGRTHAICLEITQPVKDVSLPAGVKRLYCDLLLEEVLLGVITFNTDGEIIRAATIADAIATKYAWPILGRFFEHTLYPSIMIERDSTGVSLWRESICLGTGLLQEESAFWSVAHDQVGWTLFLQELWNRPDWPNERFYDPEYVEASAPCSYFADRQFSAEVSETLLDVVTNQQKLEVTLAVGGAPLGCVIVPVSQNRVRAQEMRAALTIMGSYNLCRLAVRQGLIGKSLMDPTPLRARLLAAARQCYPDERGLNPLRKVLIYLQKSRLVEWLQKRASPPPRYSEIFSAKDSQ